MKNNSQREREKKVELRELVRKWREREREKERSFRCARSKVKQQRETLRKKDGRKKKVPAVRRRHLAGWRGNVYL